MDRLGEWGKSSTVELKIILLLKTSLSWKDNVFRIGRNGSESLETGHSSPTPSLHHSSPTPSLHQVLSSQGSTESGKKDSKGKKFAKLSQKERKKLEEEKGKQATVPSSPGTMLINSYLIDQYE